MYEPKIRPSGVSPDTVKQRARSFSKALRDAVRKKRAQSFGIALRDEAAREILKEDYYDVPPFNEAETQQFEREVDYRVRQKLIGERDSLAIQNMIEQVCEEDGKQ